MNALIEQLAGTWFIISTNFPMWLKGDKQSPSFKYSVINRNEKKVLADEVSYYQDGKLKYIRGFDVPDTEKNSFIWRGKGLLSLLKSEWKIRIMNEEEGWAVIWFSKTFFTPEGVDVISREKVIGPQLLDHIKEQMLEDSILKRHVKRMVLLR
jgi:hypothetical protein